uniref:Activin types I and II receptor domain-containing protein n=1 Tax=Anopheles atroparvus TaxID=41427 RepID=A0A182IKW3_ANOAO
MVQQTKDHRQPNGKYSSSNENFSHPASSVPSTGGVQALAPASLQAASPQTMTLTADKNKTKLLKCHCDICKDENYVCETDGLCFTSVTKEADGKHKYSYRAGPPTGGTCSAIMTMMPPLEPNARCKRRKGIVSES